MNQILVKLVRNRQNSTLLLDLLRYDLTLGAVCLDTNDFIILIYEVDYQRFSDVKGAFRGRLFGPPGVNE